MYVRWKKRMRTRQGVPTGMYALTAVLVEGVRVNGKPRQRFVAYLGTIWGIVTAVHGHRLRFWKRVDANLDRLTEPVDRERTEAKLAEVVPRPTAESQAEALRRLAEIEKRLGRSA